MTADVLSKWIVLGCPVVVKSTGRKCYLLHLCPDKLEADQMMFISDSPRGGGNSKMQQRNAFPAKAGDVELDLSLVQ